LTSTGEVWPVSALATAASTGVASGRNVALSKSNRIPAGNRINVPLSSPRAFSFCSLGKVPNRANFGIAVTLTGLPSREPLPSPSTVRVPWSETHVPEPSPALVTSP
jgi:hypothetical protein